MKQAVLSYYPVISNLFYDELGERLSPELRDIYLWASQGANQMKENLRQIQQDLGEITRDARPIHGAYYCEYEMFNPCTRWSHEARHVPTVMCCSSL